MDEAVLLVLRAADYAARAHQRQRRKDVEATPYINHLIEVAYLLGEAGCPAPLIAAGLLHDTIEDTNVTYEDVRAEFGAEIADYVQAVTDDKSLPKEARKQQQVLRAGEASAAVAALKIADKISNLRSLDAAPPANWPVERKREYVEWADQVVGRLPDVPPMLRERHAVVRAKLVAL